MIPSWIALNGLSSIGEPLLQVSAMKRPFYESEFATLYCGDVLEVLPELQPVDITVTSPPYNTLGKRIPKRGTGNMKGSGWIAKVNAIGYEDSLPEDLYQVWLAYVMALCLDRSRGLVWLNHKVRYRNKVGLHPLRFLPFELYSEVIWARAGSIALNCKRFAPSHEGLWAFGKPHWWDDSMNKLLSVWSITQEANRTDHPCPFPIALAERPILCSCPSDGVVLDPFAGSGTVGVAAIRHGRRFVGIEKNRDYCKAARRRLREAERAMCEPVKAAA